MLQSERGAEVLGSVLPHQHSEAYSVPLYLNPLIRQLRAHCCGVCLDEVPLELGRARFIS